MKEKEEARNLGPTYGSFDSLAALIANLDDAATVYVREGLNLQVSKNTVHNFQRNQTSFNYEGTDQPWWGPPRRTAQGQLTAGERASSQAGQ